MKKETLIQRYADKKLSWLLAKAQEVFNAWVRARDAHRLCISCQKNKVEQAGHFYNQKNYSYLRFSEDNVHGQCIHCNHFLSGNLLNYRKGLEVRIGEQKLLQLDKDSMKRPYKWDKTAVIDIILKYKHYGD